MTQPRDLSSRGIPAEAKVVQLAEWSKVPAPGLRGNLSPADQGTFVPLNDNVGIILDEQYIVVDIDRPDDPVAKAWVEKLPETWTQETPKGRHYLYRVPRGYTGSNTKVPGAVADDDGIVRPAGDVKSRGYIVAPGSRVRTETGEEREYRLVTGGEPTLAPTWLLGFASASTQAKAAASETWTEKSAIVKGERDNALYRIAAHLRRSAYSESAIAAMLAGIVNSGVVEQPDGDAVGADDIRRIARSIASKPPGEVSIEGLSILPEAWADVHDIARIGVKDVRWIIDDFIPEAALVMLYGKGGIGKSTIVAWVAAQLTQQERYFGFVGAGEESEEVFSAKVRACGGRTEYLRFYAGSKRIMFPRDIDALRQHIQMLDLSCLYFDAYRSHMSHAPGRHEADRTRDALQPLAQLAKDSGCTVLCTTHQTKYTDDILGSGETENVARVVLRVYAPKGMEESGTICVAVKKSNLPKPEGHLVVNLGSTVLRDAVTDAVQMQKRNDGTRVAVEIGYVRTAEIGIVLATLAAPPEAEAEPKSRSETRASGGGRKTRSDSLSALFE